jgi:acyl-CoA thioesterase
VAIISDRKLYNLMNVLRNGEKPPCDHTLGITILSMENGIAKGKWNADPKFLNGNGVIMGGFVSAVADTMMAYAISSLINGQRMFSSINLQTIFHRPVNTGIVDVEAKIERMGKSIAYATATLWQNGKEVAVANSSIILK